MKRVYNTKLFNEQITNLEDDLQELLEKAEIIIGYKTDGIRETVNELMSLNTQKSVVLATDILDIEEDIIRTEEYEDEEEYDDPFTTLYNEDEDEL